MVAGFYEKFSSDAKANLQKPGLFKENFLKDIKFIVEENKKIIDVSNISSIDQLEKHMSPVIRIASRDKTFAKPVALCILKKKISFSVHFTKNSFINVFEFLSFLIIVFNRIILSIDSSSNSENELKTLGFLDFFLQLYFYLEVLIRIIIERSNYWKSFLNMIDLFLFGLNISFLISLESKAFNSFTHRSYQIIRGFQVIRVFRLVTSKKLWFSMAILIEEVINVLKKLTNFLILLIIYIVFASLIGKTLFLHQKINHLENPYLEEEIQRNNFLNISNSLFSNFSIFFVEDWHILMVNHMKMYGYINFCYFIANILISAMFLNKIFLALLINKLIESKYMNKIRKAPKSSPFLSIKIRMFFSKFLKRTLMVSSKK